MQMDLTSFIWVEKDNCNQGNIEAWKKVIANKLWEHLNFTICLVPIERRIIHLIGSSTLDDASPLLEGFGYSIPYTGIDNVPVPW